MVELALTRKLRHPLEVRLAAYCELDPAVLEALDANAPISAPPNLVRS